MLLVMLRLISETTLQPLSLGCPAPEPATPRTMDGDNNGQREIPKRPRRLSEQHPQEQDAGHHLPGERCEAPRYRHLVRQFFRAAPPRRPFAAGLQARDLDHHAGGSAAAVRGCQGGGGGLTPPRPTF